MNKAPTINYDAQPEEVIAQLADFGRYLDDINVQPANAFHRIAGEHSQFDLRKVFALLQKINTHYALAELDDSDSANPTLPFELDDMEDGTDTCVTGKVTVSRQGVFIAFNRFQTYHDDVPVLVEQIGGIPRVVVWTDRNQEDSTHQVGLSGAEVPSYRVGDRLFWTDPDEGLSSGWVTVTNADRQDFYMCQTEGGGVTEIPEHELSREEPQ